MGLESFGSDIESTARHGLEIVNRTGRVVDEFTESLLRRNGLNIELLDQKQSLLSDIDSLFLKNMAKPGARPEETFGKLEALREKCQSAGSIKELKSLRQEYASLLGTVQTGQYQKAVAQTGINARAGLAAGGRISDVPKIADTAASAPIKPVNTAVQKAAGGSQSQTVQEALKKRIQAKKAAAETAEKAQKFYTSLSDVSTGKSAQESAEIIEKALSIKEEALRRTQAEEAAKVTAEKAQKFYTSLSDVSTGKSAQESAEIIEKALSIKEEALRRNQAKEAAKVTSEKAQKFYTSLSDVTTGKSAQESAEIIEKALKTAEEQQRIVKESSRQTAETIIEQTTKHTPVTQPVKEVADNLIETKTSGGKVQNFISNKVMPFFKTKQFKFILAGIAATAIGIGIIKYKKSKENEENKTQKLDIVK